MSGEILLEASKLMKRHVGYEGLEGRLSRDIPRWARLKKLAYKFHSVSVSEAKDGLYWRYRAVIRCVPRVDRPIGSLERDESLVVAGIQRACDHLGWGLETPAAGPCLLQLPADSAVSVQKLTASFPWFPGDLVAVLAAKLNETEVRKLGETLSTAVTKLKEDAILEFKSQSQFQREVAVVKAGLGNGTAPG